MRTWNFARRPFLDDRPAYAVAGVLFLIGTAFLFGNLRVFTEYRRQVADTRAEIAALETRQRGADEKARAARAALASYRLSALADESRALSRIAAERKFSWTALLARLERTLPSDVGLSNLQPRFDEGEIRLDLQLLARNREAVVKTIAALSKDPAFTGVEVRSETEAEAGAAEPFRFLVGCRYEPEARR